MSKYKVTVCKTIYIITEVVIEAKDKFEAEEIALRDAKSYFNPIKDEIDSIEYTVEDKRLIK